MTLAELNTAYVQALDREQALMTRLRAVRHELDQVEEQVRGFERTFRPVPDDLLDSRYKLLAEVSELQHELEEVMDEQRRLRSEISWAEYQERQRRMIEGQDWDLDTVQRMLELWPWQSPQVP